MAMGMGPAPEATAAARRPPSPTAATLAGTARGRARSRTFAGPAANGGRRLRPPLSLPWERRHGIQLRFICAGEVHAVVEFREQPGPRSAGTRLPAVGPGGQRDTAERDLVGPHLHGGGVRQFHLTILRDGGAIHEC